MARSVEATGKTIEEAITAACATLGVHADDPNVNFEVVAMPRNAGRPNDTPAKIRLHVGKAETGGTAPDTRRVHELEKQVATLEEALKTLQNMQSSERMQEYVKQTQKTLDVAALVNATATDHRLDLDRQRDAVRQIQAQQASMEEQIRKSMAQTRRAAQGSSITDDPSLFAYENVTNDTIAITGFNGFDCGDVLVIPETIDGKRVVKIADRAFQNVQMEEVDFPKSLREIGEESFSNCSRLKTLDLNHTQVTQIGKNAFSGCSSLESVDLQNTAITTMGAHCFDSCENLRKAALPARLEAIPYMCFANCIAIKQIKIPDTVKKIEADAFYGTAIKNVVIPENVEVVSANAFPQSWKCKSMTLSMACLGMQTRVEKIGIIRMPIDTTFYCLPGSAAQRFAQQYQYKCRPLSEALSDGRLYDEVNDKQETTARRTEQEKLATAMKNSLNQMR